ncbi:hypothetical protein PFLG_03010, partial [Plasmodium falciparum RAJ116]
MSYVGPYCECKCNIGHKVGSSWYNNDDINDVIKHEFGSSEYNNDDISDDSSKKGLMIDMIMQVSATLDLDLYNNDDISDDSSKKLVINDIIVHVSAPEETEL